MQALPILLILLVFVANTGVMAQAAFSLYACILYCPDSGQIFAPRGGPCRDNSNCALAFTDSSACPQNRQYQAIPFTTIDGCNNYQSIVTNIRATVSPDPTSAVNQAQSQNASCSCNTIVSGLLNTIKDEVIPNNASATAAGAICSFLGDKMVEKLMDKPKTVCTKATSLLGSYSKDICDLVFNLVNGVLSPIKAPVVSLCSTVLQTLLDVFHLTSSIQSLLYKIQQEADRAVNSASNYFCGATICSGPTQASCSRQSNGLQSVVSTGSAFLCNVLAGSDSSCFPSRATIGMCDGSRRSMADLAQFSSHNALVRAVDGTCSPVMFFSSHDETSFVTVVRVYVKPAYNHESSPNGGTIIIGGSRNDTWSSDAESNPLSFDFTATQSLLIFGGNYVPMVDGRLVTANALQVGDLIWSSEGSPVVVMATVMEYHTGLYHPHLESLKDYSVDGVVVSQYTHSLHPAVARRGLAMVSALSSLGFPVTNTHARHVVNTFVNLPVVSNLVGSPEVLDAETAAPYITKQQQQQEKQSEHCLTKPLTGYEIGDRISVSLLATH